MKVESLGEAKFPSPVARTVRDGIPIPLHLYGEAPDPEAAFELAGPRERLYFDPKTVRAGLVTCGGLCPGLNNVIRSVFMALHHTYGVRSVIGYRYGYRGLDPNCEHPPLSLNPDFVNDIHKHGGTVLGTSRGHPDIPAAVRTLARDQVNVLFAIGGDGTQRGANALHQEARRQGLILSVVGIPKTVDNDVAYVSRTFGYLTAVEEACKIIDRAHTEAKSVENGISLVRLMGRNAGFIAAGATISSQDVNFCLVPEVPVVLNGPGGFLQALKRRMLDRRHAVIAVAEGAGQDLLSGGGEGTDASGNARLKDIGPYLMSRIEAYFKAENLPVVLRYFDPSYIVRSSPADSEDAILCDQFARHAVHAAMAGKTGLVIGYLHDCFIHVPMERLATEKKAINPNGEFWDSVLAATGQPARFE
jgi:6-phosphofructokinase 1